MNTKRPPIVAVLGHIDHGKSTLLSYIRKSNRPLNEAGGITQHISAYEIEHKGKRITFLDTPGHEAFGGIRERGAKVADIAVLVVSAEDGVKPQTLEALRSIIDSKTPYIVAINKIDKPEANIERTKQSLAEHEIYIEGYGGDIPVVEVSAKTGQGVPELLDMIDLVAELENLEADPSRLASGIVIESNRDARKGISATCIVTDGTLRKGEFVGAGAALSPVRILENFEGKALAEASFSSPIKIFGWDELPYVGETFQAFATRGEAEKAVETWKAEAQSKKPKQTTETHETNDTVHIPIIIKADTSSSLEAAIGELKKIKIEHVTAFIISSGIGAISENDIRLAHGSDTIVAGFHTTVDAPAKALADRSGVTIHLFDIIYKMSEWLAEALKERRPKMKTETQTGQAKILKAFSRIKDRQVVGARVESGEIKVGSDVRIIRRETEIGRGKVRELQVQKNKTSEVSEGKECGAMIESKIEIMPGDFAESFIIVES